MKNIKEIAQAIWNDTNSGHPIDQMIRCGKELIAEVRERARAINGFNIDKMMVFNAISIEDLEKILSEIEG